MTSKGVRRAKAALFQWVKIPPGEMLQPEATGAGMEVTKCLKPSGNACHKYGDSASVQAVTRVNAEQTSKRTMRRPTRQPLRGRLIRVGCNEQGSRPIRCVGVVATACTQGKRAQHGKPHGVVRDGQPNARERRFGHCGVTERPVVPGKPGNTGGGKGPWFKTDARRSEDVEIG
jgi:hypothetical protein